MSQANILIVDDTLANLHLLTKILNDQGYEARPVPSGALAFRAIAATTPDLILLDINMPEMDGYAVCRQLKANPATKDIPVIFISALDETLDKVKAFTVGGIDYITKPFHIAEVLARIDTHLTLRRLQVELQTVNTMLEKRVANRTAELVQLNAVYEQFVPREFLSFLHKDSITDITLGDQTHQEMTVMFADVRDFTALSEQMTPQQTFNFLNDYLRQISPVINAHDGFIDKYIGDGLMALFPRSAEAAVQAAIAMNRQIAQFNKTHQDKEYPTIRFGTGLHTGKLMLGIIGGGHRLQGTVIADAVNLAARVEELTKLFGVSIIATQQTLQQLPDPDAHHHRFLGQIRVKGRRQLVSIYELFDTDTAENIQLKEASKATFETAVKLYGANQVEKANQLFAQLQQQNPNDSAVQFYLQQSHHQQLETNPFPDTRFIE